MAKIRPEILELKDYIPGKTPKDPGVIKLASNENPFGASPKALLSMAQTSKTLHIYPDQKSILLKEALAKQLGLTPENIIVGNGSDDIMQIATATFLNPGEEVVIPKHTFSLYEFVCRIMGGKPIFVDLKDLEQDLLGIQKCINEKTKMIFLCNPHNPTGSYISAEVLSVFMASVPENILVIADEAYMEFADAPDFPNTLALLKQYNNLLVLRTFSKYYGLAGLRLGYGIAHADLIKPMLRAKLPFNVNRLAQAAGVAALDDKRFLEKTYKNNLEGKKYFYAEFDKLGLSYKKTQANFICIQLNKPADEIFLELMKKGVIIRPLTSFGLAQAIRISIGTKEQNKKLVSCLKL